MRYIVLILVFFCSCRSAKERAEKRLSDILNQYPDLVKTDTLIKDSLIVIPGARKDSIIPFLQKDTIFLQSKNMTLKYYFRGDSTVYIQGECKPVGYINKEKTITHTITVTNKELPWWGWMCLGGCIIMLALSTMSIFRK